MVEIERRRGRSIATRNASMRRSRSIVGAKVEVAETSSPDVAQDSAPVQSVTATSDAAPQRYRFTPPALDPATPARAASTILLASLGDAVRATVEQIVRGDEPEAVHDLRLALRRTRCLLGPLRGVFTRAETARVRTGLRWLGELSGPPRDLELLIERLEASREKLPEEDRGAIEALLSLVGRDRDQARRALLKGSELRSLRPAGRRLGAPRVVVRAAHEGERKCGTSPSAALRSGR